MNTASIDPGLQQQPSSVSDCLDLQVNGFAGVDFNAEDLTPKQLHFACQRLRDDGVASVLATIITERIEVMLHRLRRLVQLREQDELAKEVIEGIHIEGPFISPEDGYRGAHPADGVIEGDVALMQRLLDAAGGLARVVTLAPEHDPQMMMTKLLSKEGIVISAGHCDPTLDQLDAAIDQGLSMFTHLGNGCPMSMHRHDNIIQRVLSRADQLWLCFIADGVHVPPAALSNYLQIAGDRAVIVSDAMAAAGLGPGLHRLGRWEVEVGDELAAWAPGRKHLVGSAMSMQQMADSLRAWYGFPPERIAALLRDNPRRALGEKRK